MARTPPQPAHGAEAAEADRDRALAASGRRVPQDVAVVGFDDIPAACLTSPPLTTMMQDIKGAGAMLVETLLAHVEQREPPACTLPAQLVVRGSTGA